MAHANEISRLVYDVSKINPLTILDDPEFLGFYDEVHLDEKWFELTEIVQRFIKVKGEPSPHRTCKSKKFIPKLMFLCAIARPRFHPETNECIFDGKLGIWPFIERVEARRSSANRARGTIEIKPRTVDRVAYAAMLENELIPAILTKFPHPEQPLKIQQDNAKPHIPPNDEQFLEAAASQGLRLTVIQQSPNSPDQNINDLGFFAAIQSLQQVETASTLEELITNVQNAYNAYSPYTLEKIWITYQQCMIKCMEEHGGNKFKVPHMRKDALARQGLLQHTLHVPIQLVNEVQEILNNEQYH